MPIVTPLPLEPALLEIHQVNVGWGSSVLIKGPDGTTVLLEAGDVGDGDAHVVPYLQSVGVSPAGGLDYTIAGHQHCDHIGGMSEVIGAGYDVAVRNYYNGSDYASSCVTDWHLAAATTTAGPPVVPLLGEQIALGDGATLTIIAVDGRIIGGGTVAVSNENDRSIAVLVQYGGFDYLWASDLGGGDADNACTGRSTSQTDVETSVVQAISPAGDYPMISAGGIDVLYVNHHGSESSTNMNWMNYSAPAVAIIGTGDGQLTGWDFPRKDVVENVLQAGGTCISVPEALVLQTEEGPVNGTETSVAGYCVGNIAVTTDGLGAFTVSGDGDVHVGPNEVAAAALPRTIAFDDITGPPDTTPPSVSITAPADGTVVSQTVPVSADASDDVGVTRVELRVDGGFWASDAVAPYVFAWDSTSVGDGPHLLRADAFDAAGNVGQSVTISVTVDNASTAPSVLINEILANEPGGNTAAEFVEVVNFGAAALALDDWTISDGIGVRHTFASGTTLAGGEAMVVFGGASAIPGGLDNAVAASSGALGFNNSGDTVTLSDGTGVVDELTYPSSLAANDGESMNRDPDGSPTGSFVLHTTISTLASSPGTRADGSDFGGCGGAGECDDGDACNGDETCQSGICVPGAPLGCDDGNLCTLDTCDPIAGCQNAPAANGTSCADGDPCNGDETCVSGSCSAGSPLDCDDGDACTVDACDAAAGCSHIAPACGLADGCCVGGCGDPDCSTSICGNGVCEGNGEDCTSCPTDCRCSGRDCSNGCCGDGACTASEHARNCPVDCAD